MKGSVRKRKLIKIYRQRPETIVKGHVNLVDQGIVAVVVVQTVTFNQTQLLKQPPVFAAINLDTRMLGDTQTKLRITSLDTYGHLRHQVAQFQIDLSARAREQ